MGVYCTVTGSVSGEDGTLNTPVWWDWELELTPHLHKRMIQRGFNEIELRDMLSQPTDIEQQAGPGRWLVRCRRADQRWVVVVEPDTHERMLVVITAYRLED